MLFLKILILFSMPYTVSIWTNYFFKWTMVFNHSIPASYWLIVIKVWRNTLIIKDCELNLPLIRGIEESYHYFEQSIINSTSNPTNESEYY